MIYDSAIWKDELEKKVIEFKQYLSEKIDLEDEKFAFKVEEFYFITSFIVRKLIESFKLSDEYRGIQYRLIKYKRNEDEFKIDLLNNHKIKTKFDFESPQEILLGTNKICNLVIHSYIFLIAIENESLNGI